MPEGEEASYLDFIVVGFDEQERILVSPTSGIDPSELESLVGSKVFYEDYKSVLWRGRVVEVLGDVLVIVFGDEGQGGENIPPGLGQGSLVRIPAQTGVRG
jgi:hypothetical protein